MTQTYTCLLNSTLCFPHFCEFAIHTCLLCSSMCRYTYLSVVFIYVSLYILVFRVHLCYMLYILVCRVHLCVAIHTCLLCSSMCGYTYLSSVFIYAICYTYLSVVLIYVSLYILVCCIHLCVVHPVKNLYLNTVPAAIVNFWAPPPLLPKVPQPQTDRTGP